MSEMPFGFTWCYEDAQCNVLILGEPTDVPSLDIEISNILPDKNIVINSIDGVSQADENNYHFKLTFFPGTLAEPSAIDVESADWSISYVSNADEDSIYLLWTGLATLLFPEDKMKVILTGVAAQSTRIRETTTNVNISWVFEPAIEVLNPSKIPEEGDYDNNTTLTLELVQSTGESNIPLYVGFVNCNKVLNTHDEASSLQLRLTNTQLPSAADPDITFHYGADINLSSQLVVTLEVGTVDDVPWALGTQDQVNNITVSIPGDQWLQNGDIETIEVDGVVQGLQWTFIPQGAEVVLAARKTMLINLENIITSHPTGEANLYLNYQYVPGYKDGQFVCQIEKAPLTFDDKVRVGTRKELDGLLTVKDGISLDEPGDIQHEHGDLNFGSTRRQMINLFQEGFGIGVQDDTIYFRTNKNFGWYQGGSHSDSDLTSGEDGRVDMVLDNGCLGIGITNPESKLEVNGSLKVHGRIKDKTGYVVPVGTVVPYVASEAPEGWLVCNGDTFDTSKYSELYNLLQSDELPDLRNRFIVGSGEQYALHDIGGANSVTLTLDQIPSHNHAPDSDYNRVLKHDSKSTTSHTDDDDRTGSEPNVTVSKNLASKGGGKSHENRPPYYALKYIIKC